VLLPEERARIEGAIALLGQDPRPPKAIALSGRPVNRLRVGHYRIIYTVQYDVLLVVVVNVRHRRDI
jgi:mRNA interferase RelE/StbE